MTDQVEFYDVWEGLDSPVVSDINESEKLVDGVHVIGRVVGECFFPGGKSRNRRIYSKKLWENTLQKLNESNAFKNRDIMGTVGHGQPLDEKAILNGHITHIVNNMWISEDNKGMGEFLILGTEGGKNLYTLLKAGKKIPFSTRSKGSSSGRDREGNEIVNEDTYILEAIDFVVNPGFVKAIPSIIESVEDSIKPIISIQSEYNTLKDIQMTDNAINSFNEHLKSELSVAKTERDALLMEKATLSKLVESLQSDLSKLPEYEKLGTPEEISESLDKATGIAIKYAKTLDTNGAPEVLAESLSVAREEIALLKSKLESFEALGTVDTFESMLNGTQSYKLKCDEFFESYGDQESIKRLIDLVSDFQQKHESFNVVEDKLTKLSSMEEELSKFVEENGSLADVSKVLSMTSEFVESVGSFSEVNKALDAMSEFFSEYGPLHSIKKTLTKVREDEEAKVYVDLADELCIPLEKVLSMKEQGFSVEDIRKVASILVTAPAAPEEPESDVAPEVSPEVAPTTSTTAVSESFKLKGAAYLMSGTSHKQLDESVITKKRSRASILMG